MRLRALILSMFLACAACGSSAGAPALLAPDTTSSDTLSVQWVGIDERPLAVGSQLAVSFQLPATAENTAADDDSASGTALVYTVSSSAPQFVSVADQGGQRLLVSVNAPGAAILQITSDQKVATFRVYAEIAASVTFSDLGHLAAGLDTTLPRAFDLYSQAQEHIAAQVVDEYGVVMNSWGLTQGRGEGAIAVTKTEPEQFVLSAEPSASGVTGTFVAGLGALANATDTQTLAYSVTLVPVATGASLQFDSATQTVLVKGLISGVQVFGIDDWEFTCEPSESCTVSALSTDAARLSYPVTSAPGSFTVSVASPSQGLPTISLAVP